MLSLKTEPDFSVGYKTTYSNNSKVDVAKDTITNYKIKLMSQLLNNQDKTKQETSQSFNRIKKMRVLLKNRSN